MFTSTQNSFVGGELSPSLWGRADLPKYHQSAFTMRNFFPNYRGGASTRAGGAYVGTCKQPGTAAPPRDIDFQFSLTQGYALEFGDNYMRVKYRGAYVTETPIAITSATQSDPCILHVVGHGWSTGDWVYVSGVGGMTELNGLTWVVTSLGPDNISLTDLFGVPLNSGLFSAYTSGGTAARIYTLATPWLAVDLPYLKVTQSADTMTLCCVNSDTKTEYPPYELVRHSNTNWVLTQDTFASSIAAPTNVQVTARNASDGTTPPITTQYSYVVTAVDGKTGEESIASSPGGAVNVDIGVYAGSNSLTWDTVPGAGSYNIYKATPAYSAPVPIGSLYGYAGTAYSTGFTDTNITQDYTQVPPTHQNPFASATVEAVTITSAGTHYTQSTSTCTITSATGTGFVGIPVVGPSTGIVDVVIENGGENYSNGDTLVFSSFGTLIDGSGAAGTLTIGPTTGIYPSVPAYFQQRRVYANTLNNPDTYYFSQIGAYNNMDSSIPTTAADAIIGTPWAQQVNGIQFLVPMPGGLVVFTGLGAWQLNGGGSAALTAADQNATPQASNGCNNLLPPIVRNYDILFLQQKGSIFRDLSYNFFVNIYTGTDLTVLSDHLFFGYTFNQWCSAEEPYKLIWCVRDDGVLISLTYLKEQDVYAWARHDTNGQYVGVCSVTEPPVDAVYTIVKRYVRGQWMYYSERFDNRIWTSAEDCFCVDAGLTYPQTAPNATLTVTNPAYPDKAATGAGNVGSVLLVTGGSGYTAPVVTVPSVHGSGATFSVTVVAGVITAIVVTSGGSGYAAGVPLVITDATGSGAVAQAIVTNNVTCTASAAVLGSAQIGDVIRVGGGVLSVSALVSSVQVTANVIRPITNTITDDPDKPPAPSLAGSWTITTPISVVEGLNHLEGLTVTGLADGGVIPPQVVTNGAITLSQPASAINVGLGFTSQLQTPYIEPPGQPEAAQGKRKNIYKASLRVQNTRGLCVGANQPDASAQPGGIAADWTGMIEIKSRNAATPASEPLPLFTGDYEPETLNGGWNPYGQVAIQQSYPLPANVLSVVSWFQLGDTSG